MARKKRSPGEGQAAFWAAVEQQGGRPAPGATYINTQQRVDLICGEGHVCAPRPADVLRPRPGGICRVCGTQNAGRRAGSTRTANAEAAFWARVQQLGGRPAPEAQYVNSATPVSVICAAGHVRQPYPSNVMRGVGICAICAGRDRSTAEAAFLARMEKLGAELAPGARYTNALTPVDLICAAGHACRPLPVNVMHANQGICRTCAGLDPQVSAAAFWARVRESGAQAAPGATYVNAYTPVPLFCASGHRCETQPSHLQQGRMLCRTCAGLLPPEPRRYDRVYLLWHRDSAAVKVGIAMGEARVEAHIRRRGYRLLAEWTGLAHESAVAAERAVLSSWRAAGLGTVLAAPDDGWTETAPYEGWAAAHAQLVELLGPYSRGDLPEGS